MMLIRTRWYSLSRRGACLVLFGVLFVLFGYSYLTIPASSMPIVRRSLHTALSVAPIEAYGWAWVICGALALFGGLIHRVDWIGFAAAVFMPIIWAVVYFAAQINDHLPRAWVQGVLFTVLAGIIAILAGQADPLDADRPPGRRRRRWR